MIDKGIFLIVKNITAFVAVNCVARGKTKPHPATNPNLFKEHVYGAEVTMSRIEHHTSSDQLMFMGIKDRKPINVFIRKVKDTGLSLPEIIEQTTAFISLQRVMKRE
jgi:hypothetical protein